MAEGSKSPASLPSNREQDSVVHFVLDPPEASCGIEAESRKLRTSKFKGVVPQPNGRWGAQIYEKHQRVWLGTFNEQGEAARVYDVAAQRFRGRDATTNFEPLMDSENSDDTLELLFLNTHSKTEIVDMLRKHTYRQEFQQSRRYYSKVDWNNLSFLSSPSSMVARESLFDKTVTPSDVGKLNRLVIPKQHAEKHFPPRHTTTTTTTPSTCKGVLLNFEDPGGKVWRFRYSYWSSSQSYVLTKGWSRFVKEKNLKAGDVVCFQIGKNSTRQERQQLFIDWKPSRIPDPVPLPPVWLFGVNIFEVPQVIQPQ